VGKVGGEGMKEPRLFSNLQDLDMMYELLSIGRKANNGSYYIHQGDLKWWLYYPPIERDYWDDIHLWDNPEQPDRLLGWALISPNWVGFDVFTHPELRGTPYAQEMYCWAEEQALRIAQQDGKPTIYVLWIFHDDDFLDNFLKQRGYRKGRGMVHMTRSLNLPISPSHVDAGFEIRNCKGESEVAARATAQFGAFKSTVMFERYLNRFTNFMRSPVYEPELDIVAVAPDGQVGAFCIVWTDPANQVGLFEPVGTHPEFQRKGLGKAVMQEGLRRLQQRGIRSAIVSTFEDNPAAIKLYESVGFQIVNRLGTYEKDV
jgi:mycothiol synthase